MVPIEVAEDVLCIAARIAVDDKKARRRWYDKLGKKLDETVDWEAAAAYYKDLSFDNDLNPQSGSNEATALVTRFTTKDRIAATVAPEYPVMVRALTRSEWLRVLARGFHVECRTPERSWQQTQLEDLFEDIGRRFPGREVDRQWRMDLLDAFSYMRNVDPRGFPAKARHFGDLFDTGDPDALDRAEFFQQRGLAAFADVRELVQHAFGDFSQP